MTTVAQMIEWMKTLPQDAEVECGVEEDGAGYSSNYMVMSPVDIPYCDVHDYTSEEDRLRYPYKAGKVIVQLRGE